MFDWVGQISPAQRLPGQMSLRHICLLFIIQVKPMKLPVKYGQNGMSNILDIAIIEFPVGRYFISHRYMDELIQRGKKSSKRRLVAYEKWLEQIVIYKFKA